jgi:PAS domain S-box-containing protein
LAGTRRVIIDGEPTRRLATEPQRKECASTLESEPTSVLQSESEWQRLFDLSHDLFCIAGFDGYFKRVNLAFERALGYSREELLSRPFLDIVHPDDLQSSRDALADLQRGEDVIGFVNRVICADGSARWLEWNTRTIPDEGFAYGIARDVTDRRHAEADLREAQRMVEASRDEFRLLAEEQAALRRVATLVARRVLPNEVFAVVAKEVGRVVHVPVVSIVRYEADGTAAELASFSGRGELFPVGTRWSLEGTNVVAQVRESGRPARIDDYSGLEGMIAETARRAGIRSTVGIPIVVAGRMWGAMVVSSAALEPLPEGTEARLAGFTELAATAISNAESQAALGRLADEQAALRRVATLVAQGAPPEELFAAVTEEVGRLLGAGFAGMARYESDDMVTVLATWAADGEHGGAHPLVPGPWPLEGGDLASMISRTGRPVRIDDYHGVPGRIAAFVRDELGIGSSVGSPIVVEGRLWGALFLHSKQTQQPLPRDTESRLTGFTELVATAIANTESRAALAVLADEQEALRRVATLVARGLPPAEIFAAVAEEVGRLVSIDGTRILRYEADGTATVIAGWSDVVEVPPELEVGARLALEGESVSTMVFRTGRPARIDSYADAAGPLSESLQGAGVRSAAGAPIIVEGRLWGVMAAGSIKPEPLPPGMELRLGEFTELVATAIANAESRAELTASRARIIAASDEARRRIERDLHDGAQQRLVSLVLELRAAEGQVPSETGELRGDVSRVAEELESVLDDLREMSRGIHPAILAEGGLGPALKTLARRAPIPVEVDVRAETRLPEPIEVAAYYVASEALTNAVRHAQASVVGVTLEEQDGAFQLSIRDDGAGGADPRKGSGLIGLHDRVEALGGSIDLSSAVGEGTLIVVEFPLEPGATMPTTALDKPVS